LEVYPQTQQRRSFAWTRLKVLAASILQYQISARGPVESGELVLIVAQHVFDYFAASIPASFRNDQKGFGPVTWAQTACLLVVAQFRSGTHGRQTAQTHCLRKSRQQMQQTHGGGAGARVEQKRCIIRCYI